MKIERPALLWRLLLATLPAELRAEYGEELLLVTHERLRAERRRGLRPWLLQAARTVADFVRTAVRMRRPRLQLSPDPRWTTDMLLQDLRYSLRSMLARPTFALAVIVTLALGIGANTLIYSMVDALVLNPFAFPDPDRVLAIGTEFPRMEQELTFFESMSGPEYLDVEGRATSLEAVAGFDMGNRQIMGRDQPQNVRTGFWWNDPLPVLGLEPLVGRSFSERELERRDAVAMISEQLWRSRFAADEEIVGREVVIDDAPYVLIGVFPAEVDIHGTQLWIPMWEDPAEMPRGSRRQFNIIARSADDAGLRDVNAELATISGQIEQEYGGELTEYEGWRLGAMTWTGAQVRTLRPMAAALLAVVGLVLLMVCANVASLLLSRAAGRQQEMSVRAALGAGRGRLVRQVLSESLLLSVLGAAGGLLLAYFGLQWLQANLPSSLLPNTRPLAINAAALAYTAAATVIAGLLFGMAPALYSGRVDLQSALSQSSGAAGGSRDRRRLYDFLVSAEVALAVLLLTTSGLFLTSLWRLQTLDPGVRTEDVLTMRMTLPARYQGGDITRFFEEVAERMEGIPGVLEAASASQYPPIGFSRRSFSFPGQAVDSDSRLPVALLTIASHDYFETLEIPIQRGRGFDDDVRVDTPFVALVNQTFARRYLPENPIGERFQLGRPEDDGLELAVIGVVGDTRNTGLQSPPAPEIYVSIRQADGANNQLFVLVRTDGDPAGVLPAVRSVVAQMDPDQPIYSIATLEERMASSYATEALALRMVLAFAVLAVVLAASGIFGVVAYAVQSRSREIGLRMALGAEGRTVTRLIVRQSLTPAILGGLAGLLLSIAAGVSAAGFLSEIEAFEPGALAAVALALVLIALGASYVPARRASGIDPVDSLRAD